MQKEKEQFKNYSLSNNYEIPYILLYIALQNIVFYLKKIAISLGAVGSLSEFLFFTLGNLIIYFFFCYFSRRHQNPNNYAEKSFEKKS